MAEGEAGGPLAGQIALVTGASRGIGAATARALAAAGAHVVLTARTAKDLEAVEEQIFAVGGSATIAPADLEEPDAIARLAAAISGRWQALDILVINAAYLPTLTAAAQIDPREYNKALTLNVLAPQAMLANFDPLLKRAKAAKVIGVTASAGATPRAYWAAYGSSKAAFDNLLDCYAQETRGVSQIAVAILDPGATRTKMRARAYPGEDPASVKPPEVVADRIVTLVGEQFASPHRLRVNQA